MARTRILVVEDEGIIARDIQRQLLDLGYDPVHLAVSGEEAVERAEALRPHLVLMDIHLSGGMDGIEAAALIRERFDIPSVFLTAYATDEVVERAKRAEPLGYLVKPFDEQSLRSTVEIGLHTDQTEKELRRSEIRYRAVVESAHDAIVTADRAGRIVDWSPSAARIFGYTPIEVLGQSLTLLVPEAQSTNPLARMHEWAGREPAEPVRELVALRKDGSQFPAELQASRWETAEGWFVTGMIRDVTERERAERSHRIQLAALEAAANAIVITDREGKIEWVNGAFCRFTGFGRSEVLGRNPRDLVKSGVHGSAFYQDMWDTLLSGMVWEGELTNQRKDGTRYVEWQTITPVCNEQGVITHFIGVKRDLTEQKRLQQQFLQAQKMEVLGRLAGGIAHDFNNLLTVINGTADLALLGLEESHPVRADLENVVQAGKQAARLTRQLLAFSRRQILTPEVLDLGAHVASTAGLLRRLLGEDVRMVFHVDPETDSVIMDPGQFEQILLNLAVNARDAMPGGGTLTIETCNMQVDDSVAARYPGLSIGPHVLLAVSDTGHGMTPEVRSRIFEPFFTTKELGKGTGLGLSTVYGIVIQSSGTIRVESESGRGSRFEILLPSAGTVVQDTQALRAARSARGNETILLVEDEANLRELACRMLRLAGYTVLAASSAQEAQALVSAHEGPLDLLFTDVVLPGASGPDMARRLRLDHPDLRVLFSSGHAQEELPDRQVLESSSFLPKPYTGSSLVSKIREVLDSGT